MVASGCHGDCLHASVEVLDVSNMQLSTKPSTPTPWNMMKSTTIDDTWYLMGGWCEYGIGVLMSIVYFWRLLFHTPHQTVPTYGTNYLHSTVHNPVHSTLEDLYWQSVVGIRRVRSQCPPSFAMSLRLIPGSRLDNYHIQYVREPVS